MTFRRFAPGHPFELQPILRHPESTYPAAKFMKSCPTCNRTFDDTLTFCLVDGAILSAPFNPQVGRLPEAVRDPAPPPTEMLKVEPRGPQPTAPTLPMPPPTSASLPAEPPETIASPFVFPETAIPAAPTRPTGGAAPMKTIVAPAPEVPSAGVTRRPAAETVADVRTRAPRSYALGAIGGLVLVVVVIGGVVWLMKRNTKTVAASNPQPAAATADTNNKLPSAAAANNKPPAGPFTEKINGAEIEMVAIPGGTFQMGSPLSESGRDPDEGPQSSVTVQNFHLSKYEVTQAQYRAVMGTNPASFKGDDLPIESVSWNDALEFSRKLSSLTGRKYRLPTEAEWEYAARAGTSDQFAGAFVPNPLVRFAKADDWAVYNVDQTTSVATKRPNAWGIYDMRGNVAEWVQDWYDPMYYGSSPAADPKGPATGDARVVRGGSFHSYPWLTRVSIRTDFPEGYSLYDTGFRLVREKR
jgi:formylglycine-generating enzyme required for sulfatase activity